MANQKTLAEPISFSGVGLHTGTNVNLVIEPAPENHGIKFQRIDIESHPLIPADISLVTETQRSTTIEKNNIKVITIEHLMSALYALEVNNALVKLDGPEVPILDGSAIQYVQAINKSRFGKRWAVV